MNNNFIEVEKGIFKSKINGLNLYTLNLSKEYFEKDSIMQAIYEYSNIFFISMKPLDENFVSIIFKRKDFKKNIKEIDLVENFSNKVIDYQIRNNLERKYGYLRDLIVEHAYSIVKKKLI